MCTPATCTTCGKTTWRGCGLHIEEALAGVPTSERCTCAHPAPAAGPGVRTGLLGS